MPAYAHPELLKPLRSKWALNNNLGFRARLRRDLLEEILRTFDAKVWEYESERMDAKRAIEQALVRHSAEIRKKRGELAGEAALTPTQRTERIPVVMTVYAWACLVEMCKKRG